MRTDASKPSEEPMVIWPMSYVAHALENPSAFMDSGYEDSIQEEPSTPSLISTSISRIESWCLNLSSRETKGLNISFWICTALCFIAFFTSHWSLFLAFLIPALIMNHLRVVRRVWKIVSDYPFGPSMNGT